MAGIKGLSGPLKKNTLWFMGALVCLLSHTLFTEPLIALDANRMANGIQPLVKMKHHPLYEFIPPGTRPLLQPLEQEKFLKELEGVPPNWITLHQKDQSAQSEHLFQFNRQRDKFRETRQTILRQPIAFLWSGLLRQYLPEYQGFSVALGPEMTLTSWGIVRFKPMGLPDYLVAIPDRETRNILRNRQGRKESIEIQVLFLGTLMSDESIIYAFSHENPEEGMILPVVHIQGVQYFIQ